MTWQQLMPSRKLSKVLYARRACRRLVEDEVGKKGHESEKLLKEFCGFRTLLAEL